MLSFGKDKLGPEYHNVPTHLMSTDFGFFLGGLGTDPIFSHPSSCNLLCYLPPLNQPGSHKAIMCHILFSAVLDVLIYCYQTSAVHSSLSHTLLPTQQSCACCYQTKLCMHSSFALHRTHKHTSSHQQSCVKSTFLPCLDFGLISSPDL